MKALIIAALSFAAAAPALAEDLAVKLPSSQEPAVAAAYTDQLMHATTVVCSRATSPRIGLNYYRFQDCLKQTRAATAQKDPTGLLAQRLGLSSSLAMAAVK